MIVGGNFDTENGKSSKITKTMSDILNIKSINGGNIDDLDGITLSKLSVWMCNISNEHKKVYPKKSIGCCLICSKVIREINGQHKFTQAVDRIYKMNANAVICIEKCDKFKFTLIDALGNVWVSTENIEILCAKILDFYEWFKTQKRTRSKINSNIEKFMSIVRDNAKNVMANSGERYFGNCSTRCSKTFPAIRTDGGILVSPRNIDKEFITSDDLVLVTNEGFVGKDKPSVDTPVQLSLYEHFKNINYMIHGHAFFSNARYTDNYYCCGDTREIEGIKKHFDENTDLIVVNLKNHGYIIGSSNLEIMEFYLKNSIPIMKPFGIC